jgi:hypothetical protein
MKSGLMFWILVLLLVPLSSISLNNQVFASHNDAHHEEEAKHHYEEAVRYNQLCEGEQSCDHMQASYHYEESAKHYKALGDNQNYTKYHAYSLYHTGVLKHGDSYVLPPRHQMYIVDNPDEIQCKQSHELIFKSTTGHPHCVTSHTAEKLVSRGWGHR